MRPLISAAWAVFVVDAAGVGWLAFDGLSSSDPLGRAISIGIAELVGALLAVLLIVLALMTRIQSRIGLWLCLALGMIPIALVLSNLSRSLS